MRVQWSTVRPPTNRSDRPTRRDKSYIQSDATADFSERPPLTSTLPSTFFTHRSCGRRGISSTLPNVTPFTRGSMRIPSPSFEIFYWPQPCPERSFLSHIRAFVATISILVLHSPSGFHRQPYISLTSWRTMGASRHHTLHDA